MPGSSICPVCQLQCDVLPCVRYVKLPTDGLPSEREICERCAVLDDRKWKLQAEFMEVEDEAC